MYSPKIKEALIPRLYAIAKSMRKPMTKVVNGILEAEISEIEASKAEKGGESQCQKQSA